MNRKNRFGLKNKNTQMAASFMIKSALVLAILGILAASAHAGAFLTNNQNVNDGVVLGTGYSVFNRSDFEVNHDIWADNWNPEQKPTNETKPLNETNLEKSNFSNNGIGYYTDDTSYYNGYTGFYIGTFNVNDNGNDIETNLLPLIDYFLDRDISNSNYTYLKVNNSSETSSNDDSDSINNLKLTISYESDNKSGDWSVTDDTTGNEETINFYTVMGGGEYALYYIDPAESSGIWTTRHVKAGGGASTNSPEISHFSFVKHTETTGGGDPVPEPATMLLFGFSLMGLAGMARRRNSKF